MKINQRKGWSSLNKDFNDWYQEHNCPEWKRQKKWLGKELVNRGFIKEDQLFDMWAVFTILTSNCSTWKVQNKILSFITICMDEEIGEDLVDIIK